MSKVNRGIETHGDFSPAIVEGDYIINFAHFPRELIDQKVEQELSILRKARFLRRL